CVLVTIILPVVSVAATATSAYACSCGGASDARAFADADAVFAGKLVHYEPPPQQRVMSSADPAVWTFRVREVYKGKVTRTQEVVSPVSGATCGLEIPRAGTFLVFGLRAVPAGSVNLWPGPAKGQLFAHLCGGTRDVSAGPLEPGLADPHPPRPLPNAPR